MTAGRTRYHHGDLRNALVGAAAVLAGSGGPDAVTVRAAARAVGVTPTAAYRHFAGHAELLASVKEEAITRMVDNIRHYRDALPTDGDPVRRAVRQVAAMGVGYVRFALHEPGLFRTAYCLDPLYDPVTFLGVVTDPEHPFGMLARYLDDLVAVGYLSAARRPESQFGSLATAHGLAVLLLDGPLAGLPPERRDAVVHKALAAGLRGLADGPNAEPTVSTDPVCTGEPPYPKLD